MKPALITVGVAGLLLTSSSLVPSWAPASQVGPLNPIRLIDLPLQRAVHRVLPVVPGQPIVASFPPSCGFALTEIAGVPHHGAIPQGTLQNPYPIRMRLSVDGDPVASVFVANAVAPEKTEFDPPLIIRPGQVLTITFMSSVPLYGVGGGIPGPMPNVTNDIPELTIGGWLLDPGEV